MTAKKKTPTAVGAAQQNLAEVQATISSLTEVLAKLEQEHQETEEQIESGSLVADIDRKADLEELIGRRKTRLGDLEGRILAYAEHALTQTELDKPAKDQAGGVVSKHAEYLAATEAARTKIAEGIGELKAATTAWEEFSSPIIRRAAQAALTFGKADPLARVLVTGTGDSARLLVDGEEFTAPAWEGVRVRDAHVIGRRSDLKGGTHHAERHLREPARHHAPRRRRPGVCRARGEDPAPTGRCADHRPDADRTASSGPSPTCPGADRITQWPPPSAL